MPSFFYVSNCSKLNASQDVDLLPSAMVSGSSLQLERVLGVFGYGRLLIQLGVQR